MAARKEKCYMEVTQDELSLPLFVADSIKELSEITGASRHEIALELDMRKKYKHKYPRFVCVVMDENENDEEENQ